MTTELMFLSLDRTGRPAISNLELYTRYTSAIWTFMNASKFKFPEHTKHLSGVSFPPTNTSNASSEPPLKGSDGSEVNVGTPRRGQLLIESNCSIYPLLICGSF